MEVVVSSDGEHVVVDVFNLFSLSQNLNVVHLLVCHLIEGLDQLLPELEGELVLGEISEPLIQQPHVHVGD